jgi:hypothetical protein
MFYFLVFLAENQNKLVSKNEIPQNFIFHQNSKWMLNQHPKLGYSGFFAIKNMHQKSPSEKCEIQKWKMEI